MSQSNHQTPRDQRAAASRTPPTWKIMLWVLAGFIPVASIIALAIGWLAGSEPREILGFVLFMVVLVVIGVLGGRFKIVDRSVTWAWVLTFRFFGWVLITLGPLGLFYRLSEFVLVNLTGVFQVIVFLVWGVLLAGALLLITTESNRERLFQVLRKVGRLTPFIYAFNVSFIAMVFFSSVTYLLVEHELVRFSGPAERDVSPEALLDFYLWHFLEALPLLEVNETLHWEKPLTYDSGWVGLVLLLFKVTVIVPVFAAFVWYWAHLGRRRTRDE